MSNKAIDLAATPRTEFGKGAARRARRQRLMAAGAQTGSAPVRKPAFAAARAPENAAQLRSRFDSAQARKTVR